MTGNLLGEQTSPYLRQHADNPVHWRPWGAAAFEEARKAGKPVLLSVGYAACHWCHVMAHESFENAETAAVMNELFVNIKVDREERPDVDLIYQHALAALGQSGGWPLTMFLTPDARPFWGGTYFPPTSRWGRPAFADVLRRVAGIYRDDPTTVTRNTDALDGAIKALSDAAPANGHLSLDIIDRLARRLVREIDPFHGGTGEAPKFPQVPLLELLWRAWLRNDLDPFRRAVSVSVVNMCQGGLYDHLGGGFARYSVDERWLVPHFEKMLYDNAQLLGLLTLLWRTDRDAVVADRIHETVDWLLRDMQAEPDATGEAAFASSLDADSDGEEGRFYVWTAEEIDRILGDTAPFFRRIYDVSPAGNWEGHTILNRLAHPDPLDPDCERRLAEARRRLWEHRERRHHPARDDKVLADWNGMTIAALVGAGLALDRPAWVDAARRAYQFVLRNMTRPDGRLLHSWCSGKVAHEGLLDDYAQMARAALALHEASGDEACLHQAERWLDIVEARFAAPDGGFYMTADDAEPLPARPRSAADSATPGGNAIIADVMARLWLLTGAERWRSAAERTIAAFAGALVRSPLAHASLLNAAEILERPLQIVIVGENGARGLSEMRAAVHTTPLPTATLRVIPPGRDLPPGHPAAGKTMIEGRSTAYLCRGAVCSPPVTDPAALRAELARWSR